MARQQSLLLDSIFRPTKASDMLVELQGGAIWPLGQLLDAEGFLMLLENIVPLLPTAHPEESGKLWNNAGVLSVS